MAVPSRPDTFELSDYLGVLRRRWLLVVAFALLGLLIAGLYTAHAPKTYAGSVLVQVYPLSTVDPDATDANAVAGRTDDVINMDNEAQISRSVPVATLAARQLRTGLSPQDLIRRTSVSVPPNTTFLRLDCTASSARGASQCANAFGHAYLTNRRSTAVNAVAYALRDLRARTAELETHVRALRTRLARLPAKSQQRTTVELQLGAAGSSLTAAEAQVDQTLPLLDNLDVPDDAAVGDIAAPAIPPSSPTSPRPLVLPSGVLAGLLAGLLVAFFVDRRDLRLHAVSEVGRRLDLAVLLDTTTADSGSDAFLAAPRSSAGRGFAELAQYVTVSLGEGGHVVTVAGTSAGTGSSTVAANLAATLARTGSEVVIVCAGLRATPTPRLLGTGGGPGLSELLSGFARVGEVAHRPPDMARLRVIAPGTDVAFSPSRPLHEASRLVMTELLMDSQYVIVEMQAVGEDADFTLPALADQALVVLEIPGTRRTDASDCIRRLDRMGVPLLGAAVLPAQRSRFGGRRHGTRFRARSLPPRRTRRWASRRDVPTAGHNGVVLTADHPVTPEQSPPTVARAEPATLAGKTSKEAGQG